ncbi:MAG TPA: hypothetical protein EYP05_08530 [Piscirickettsiaceae bacterium]|nr:hypothetical protein [Piscirickettsiaceae bacterium]HIQ39745.1 hypothetical protein [Sulfurivirga caldicuralii]
MSEKLGLTRKEATILLDAVLVPFIKKWQTDPHFAALAQDRAHFYRFLAEMAHVLGALLHGESDPESHWGNVCREIRAVGVPLEVVQDDLRQLLHAFEQWVAQADEALVGEERADVLRRLERLKAFHVCDADEADDFVLADSKHSDAAIDRMHHVTTGREPISARAFMAGGHLDEETIARIVEDVEELSSELYFYGDFDQTYAEFVIHHLEEFSKALEMVVEFSDLAWAVRQFIYLLRNLPESLTVEEGMSIKQLTDQVVEDLVGWVQHVLVEQDAQDIHYLDAALMASVKQIALLLGVSLQENTVSEKPDESNDDEFIMF